MKSIYTFHGNIYTDIPQKKKKSIKQVFIINVIKLNLVFSNAEKKEVLVLG